MKTGMPFIGREDLEPNLKNNSLREMIDAYTQLFL